MNPTTTPRSFHARLLHGLSTLLLLSLVLGRGTAHGQNNWQELTSGTSTTLRSVHFVNADTGYAAGGSVVLRTMDGGVNWNLYSFPVNPPLPSANLHSVFFMSPDTGFVVGNHIYRTTNTALDWSIVFTPAQSFAGPVKSIYCSNDGIGHAAGYVIPVLKTNDFGATWSDYDRPDSIVYTSLNSVHFPDRRTGYIAGVSYGIATAIGIIIKTRNAGEDWKIVRQFSSFHDYDIPNGYGMEINSIFFTDSLSGWVVGGRGRPCHYCDHNLVLTRDGGQTWDTLTTIFPSTLNDVFFLDRNNGFVADVNGVIYSTQDAGMTWQNENAPSAGREIHDIHCAGGACYAVGEGGMILKRAVITSQGPPLDDGPAFSMFPNPANGTVTFVHDAGAPLRNARIIVRDALGREVARLPLAGQDRTVWDTRGIPPGPYLVELLDDAGRIAVQRLVLAP